MARRIEMNLNVDAKKGIASINKTSKDIKSLGADGDKAAKTLSNAFAGAEKTIKSMSKSAASTGKEISSVMRNTVSATGSSIKAMDNYTKSIEHARKSLKDLSSTKVAAPTMAAGAAMGVSGAALAAASLIPVAAIKTAENSMMSYFKSIQKGSVSSAETTKQMLGIMGANIARFSKKPWFKELFSNFKGTMSNMVSIAKTSLSGIGGGFMDMARFIKAHWLKIAAIVAGAILSIKYTLSSAFDTAKLEQAREAFYNLSSSRGLNADKLIEDLKRVSKNTVATSDIISAAGRAQMLGVPAENLTKMMEIAMATSKLTGQTVTEAFNDITLAVGRQSKMILDNLGIIVSVEKANEAYAKSINKTADKLTDAEKKQAFMNATIRAGNKLIDDIGMGSSTAADQFTQMAAAMTKVNEALKKVVSDSMPLVARLLSIFIKLAAGWSILASKMTWGDLSKDLDTFARSLSDAAYAMDDLVNAKRKSELENYNAMLEKHNKIMSETTKISPPGTFSIIPELEEMDTTVDKETADKIKDIQNQLNADLMRMKKGEQAGELELLKQKYNEYKEYAKDLKGLEEWNERSITDIKVKYHKERWDKITKITEDAVKKLEEKAKFESAAAIESMKINAKLTRNWQLERVARIAELQKEYKEQVKIHGQSIAGYQLYMDKLNEIEKDFAGKKMADKGSAWENVLYGRDKAYEELESMNEMWQRLGENFDTMVVGHITDGMGQIIDAIYEGTLTWKGFAIGVQKASIEMLKSVTQMIMQTYLLNSLKGIFGNDEGAAAKASAEGAAKVAAVTAETAAISARMSMEIAESSAKVAGLGAETAAVGAATTAYIALAAAKAAAGAGGAGGGTSFGGGMAVGGVARAGTTYVVGEKGPELFTPNRTGRVTPNDQLGGSTQVNVQPAEVTIFFDKAMLDEYMASPRGKKAQIVNIRSDPYSFSKAMGGR